MRLVLEMRTKPETAVSAAQRRCRREGALLASCCPTGVRCAVCGVRCAVCGVPCAGAEDAPSLPSAAGCLRRRLGGPVGEPWRRREGAWRPGRTSQREVQQGGGEPRACR